jgi:hypothetical protein
LKDFISKRSARAHYSIGSSSIIFHLPSSKQQASQETKLKKELKKDSGQTEFFNLRK